ncbi:hypothetical protein MMPV_007289 [Pyropia vietnamensis]
MASRVVRPPPGVAAAVRAHAGHLPTGAARRPRPAASAQPLSSTVMAAPDTPPTATAADGSGPPPPPPRRRPAETDYVVARRAWRLALHRTRVAYAAEAAAAAAEVAAARGNEAEVAAEAKRRRDRFKAARAANRSTAAAASRAAASAAADARRRVRAATWEANAAAALGRQMSLVNALTDASPGWISRDRLGDAVERLVDETYVEMDERVLDPPVSLIPAGF